MCALALTAVMAAIVIMMVGGLLPGTATAGVLEYLCFYSVFPAGIAGCLLLYYSRRLS